MWRHDDTPKLPHCVVTRFAPDSVPQQTPTTARCEGLFCLTDDGVPAATTDALAAACAAREIPYLPLHAGTVRVWELRPLPPGSLLYTPSISQRAMAIERRLFGPGVATVYDATLGPLRHVTASTAAFLYAGVPTPKAFPCNSKDRASLAATAEALGGYPLVLRFPGFSVGEGIVRVDSPAALYSALAFALASGRRPELVEFVDHAESWRVAVVGGRAVGAMRGAIPAGDFRSRTSNDPDDFFDAPSIPEDLAAVAVAATRAVDALAAGVDVLRTPDGRLLVLEANTPFYFGNLQAQGIDVAGAIVDALLERLPE